MPDRSLVFERRPGPSTCARELVLDVDGAPLSGLVATPPHEPPRALIVAIHGLGMHAGYFDSQAAPGLSLLELAVRAGYAVWAPDRPGTGGSSGLSEDEVTLFGQADLLLRAIDLFSADHGVNTAVVVVGHSYGLKVAWTMAARDGAGRIWGVDGASSGITYGFGWPVPSGDGDTGPPPRPVVDPWGPRSLYPPRALERASIPRQDDPAIQRSEGPSWPAEIRSLGHAIEVPLRLTFGVHETMWPLDQDHFDDMRTLFCNAPHLEIVIEPHAAHNVSLGWAARAYHLKVLAFVEHCLLARQIR